MPTARTHPTAAQFYRHDWDTINRDFKGVTRNIRAFSRAGTSNAECDVITQHALGALAHMNAELMTTPEDEMRQDQFRLMWQESRENLYIMYMQPLRQHLANLARSHEHQYSTRGKPLHPTFTRTSQRIHFQEQLAEMRDTLSTIELQDQAAMQGQAEESVKEVEDAIMWAESILGHMRQQLTRTSDAELEQALNDVRDWFAAQWDGWRGEFKGYCDIAQSHITAHGFIDHEFVNKEFSIRQ